MTTIRCVDMARLTLARHLAVSSLDHYGGIVTLHGLVRLAEAVGDEATRREAVERLTPFFTGKIEKVGGAYDLMYRCGGTASAWLAKLGYAPEILPVLVAKAEELVNHHPRGEFGAFGMPQAPEKVWIDSVFAVCPFLAIVGNLAGRDDFRAEAVNQMLAHHKLLWDHDVGLFNQSINFRVPGKKSADHWSRGNGWAAIGLVELAAELPDNAEIRRLFAAFMDQCAKFQDDDGLWHQEMTAPDSYVETSGTGLILYAMGYGLQIKALPERFRALFLRGLRGYLGYIAQDGSVFNTCRGCLCPGDGSIEAYKAHPWIRNDIHAFGPAVLAFAQAALIGIESIEV